MNDERFKDLVLDSLEIIHKTLANIDNMVHMMNDRLLILEERQRYISDPEGDMECGDCGKILKVSLSYAVAHIHPEKPGAVRCGCVN
jgi:hypothetical protein